MPLTLVRCSNTRSASPAAELSGKSETSPFSFNTSALLSTDSACFGNSTDPSFLLLLQWFSLVHAILLECKTTTLTYFVEQQIRCRLLNQLKTTYVIFLSTFHTKLK